MKLNFCTLFDSNYLSRGLVMYRSLAEHCPDFHLYVFPFDNKCYEVLVKLNLPHLTLVTLKEFEDEKLLSVKQVRTKTEYCWTCTSSTILYCIEKYNLQNCIYIDADLFFYQSPEILIQEKPAESHVIITSHRYTSYYDQSKVSGKYCVQFMYFDNSRESLEVLNWWRDRCIEWCFNRVEDGKFGDQKYLDDWTTRFQCIWELKNPGGGLAPWNIQQYKFTDLLNGTEIKTGDSFSTVFYHFHGIKYYENGKTVLAPNTYRISNEIIRLFYLPYFENLSIAKQQIKEFDATFDPHGSKPSSAYFMDKFVKGKLTYLKSNYVKRFFS